MAKSAATVLLVEDDDDLRESLQVLLQRRGYRTIAAAHGREALEHLQAGELPNVILLDLMMPVMNGWQLRAELLNDARFAAVPVVILSGIADLSAEAQTLQAAAYLVKPVSLPHLYDVLSAWCL